MEENNKENPQVVLASLISRLNGFGIETRLFTEDPTKINGQAFQSVLFQFKDTDTNTWVTAKTWTSAIDPAEQIASLNKNIEEIDKAIAEEEARLNDKKAQKTKIIEEANRIKSTLEPLIANQETEEVDTK